MFEIDSTVKGSLPSKPTESGFYALIRDHILTESGKFFPTSFIIITPYFYHVFLHCIYSCPNFDIRAQNISGITRNGVDGTARKFSGRMRERIF